MKPKSAYPFFGILGGAILALLLIAFIDTSSESTVPAPVAAGEIEKAFTLEPGMREAVEFNVEQPGSIHAVVEWTPAKTSLAVILFGPGQMNYFVRNEGKSPQEIKYTVTDRHTALGHEWRISVVNMTEEKVEGKVNVTYPVKEGDVMQ